MIILGLSPLWHEPIDFCLCILIFMINFCMKLNLMIVNVHNEAELSLLIQSKLSIRQ